MDERYGLKWPAPSEISRLPLGQEHQFVPALREDYRSPIHDPEFSSKVKAQAWKVTGCIFDFQPDNLRCEPDEADMEAITQALIKAGLSPEYLMSNGVFGQLEGQRDVTLKQALEKLKEMGPINWSYYRPLYREFLKAYAPQRFLASAVTPRRFTPFTRSRGTPSILNTQRPAEGMLFSRLTLACKQSKQGLQVAL